MKTKPKCAWFKKGFRVQIPLILFSGLLALTGCVRERSPVTGKTQAYGMSWNQELQTGVEGDRQIIEQYGLYEDPKLQAYVQRLGQAILNESDLRKPGTPEIYRETEIQFRVLDSPVVNAFAIPGYVYVTRGLLSHVENEAQLAVVLGHEIAHIAARHISEQALQQQVGQIGLMAGAILGSQVLDSPQLSEQLLNLGGAAVELIGRKYSRDDEREADQLGLGYAAGRGYDVAESSRFFESLKRISARDGVTMPGWYSTHPDPGERAKTVLELSRQYHPPGALLAVGQDELLRQLEGMIIGENPRQGFVANNIFFHPELQFQFPVPEKWKVNNERAAVLMVPEDESAILILTMAGGNSAAKAAENFVQREGVQVESSRASTINGLPAHTIVGQARSQQGTTTLLACFIEQGTNVYQFVGMSAAAGFDTARSQFEPAVAGFSRLSDPQVLNVRPARLKVLDVTRSAPFVTFVPANPIAGLSPEDLAIMNQVQANEIIPSGEKIKLPQVTSGFSAR